MVKHDVIDLLKGSTIFKGLSDDTLKMIGESGQMVYFRKGETIIKEGQKDHSLFIVANGKVEVVLPKECADHIQERVTRIKIAELSRGDCLGEYALIDNEPASASVIAIAPCLLFAVSRTDFETILGSSNRLAKKIYKNMLQTAIQRIRQTNRELDICFQ